MKPRMSLRVLVLAAFAMFGCASPSESSGAPSCPEADENGCLNTALSYDTGIGALLSERCSPCHAKGGVEATRPLTDYGHVAGERMSIASQLITCSMPPAGNPQLSSAERAQILAWLSCGGPK